mgnify:CR=1 FL=1
MGDILQGEGVGWSRGAENLRMAKHGEGDVSFRATRDIDGGITYLMR